MCLIVFEEKAEIKDQHPLSLNWDRDRLQKYWAINAICIIKLTFSIKSLQPLCSKIPAKNPCLSLGVEVVSEGSWDT